MVDRKGQTSVRSVRMPDGLIAELEKESESSHVSVNTIINTILFRHLEWDRYAEKFGFMGLSRETFQAMASSMKDPELTTLAKSVSSTVLKEFAMFCWEINGPKSFLEFIQRFARYSRIGEWEVRNDGPFHRASLLHKMGPKVSFYLSELYSDLLQSITGVTADIDILENEFIMKFTLA